MNWVHKMKELLIDTILFEISPKQISESINKNNGKVIVKGILQRANAKNQNGRIYPKPILMREVKKYAELQSKIWFENTDIPVSILRIFHTFGPGVHRDDTRIFASAIYDIAENRDIKLNSDGSAMRSFLYTSDLASAIQISSYQTGFQVYNVCGSEEISILKFANLVARNSTTCKVVPNSIPEVEQNKRSPIMRGIANTSRLSNLGWKPRVDIETAIDKTIRSLEWRKS